MKSSLPKWLLAASMALSCATAGAEQTELATATAELRQLPREFLLDGVVEATQSTTLSAQTSGQVQDILYDVDDYVEKDAVLVVLKDTEHQARVTQASADLKSAAARLDEARDEYKRTKEVFAKQLVSESAMDKAASALKSARAAFEAAQAGLEQSKEQLDYTRVRAPYAGIVTERHVEPGEMAQPGRPLMSGISLEQLRVTVDVPQSLIPPIRIIGEARVQQPGDGWVEAEKLTVFPIADHGSSTFKVRLKLPAGTRNMFPGMFVKTAFATGLKQELLVPVESVVYRSEVTGAYVVDDEGQVYFRHLRVGHPTGDGFITVLSGLNPGERVAVEPIAAGVALKQQRAEKNHG